MCSLYLTHPSAHTPGAVGSRHCGARGAVGGSVPCSRSHLSRGQILPEPRFEPTTSDYKSNALSIRPRLPPDMIYLGEIWRDGHVEQPPTEQSGENVIDGQSSL